MLRATQINVRRDKSSLRTLKFKQQLHKKWTKFKFQKRILKFKLFLLSKTMCILSFYEFDHFYI